MAAAAAAARLLCLALCLSAATALGINWGTQATHPLPARTVVQVLQDNAITKVKLFDADFASMSALAGTGVEVMVAIPNDMLSAMAVYSNAQDWVHQNVSRYSFQGGVNIKYVAVGNEPFLKTYNNSFDNVTLPALQNIQNALNAAGVGAAVKATIPLNADVYSGSPPSAGRFRADIAGLMASIVQFMSQNGAPFTINIYPFISLYDDPNFPVNFAFFDGGASPVVDGGIQYTNVFDANFDTLVSALNAIGYGSMPIIVGEVGWPTDGDPHATPAFAQRFYAGLLRRVAAKVGTPLRPNQDIEMYLFSLIDEDAKSVAPGNFERHWGMLRYDGQPKFAADLSGQGRNVQLAGARGVKYMQRQWCILASGGGSQNATLLGNNVNYACTFSDCTSLLAGSSCGGLDDAGKASYAFNMYYQVHNQQDESCYFQGLATTTGNDPSTGQCTFIIEIAAAAGRGNSLLRLLLPTLLATLFLRRV